MKEERKEQLLQYMAAMSASFAVIGYGCTVSWTSPALPHLTSEKSQFSVSEIQSSWIASFVNLGMILGYILNALIIDKIGRKKTLLILSVPQITACISIILARNWIILSISRTIIGIGYGGGLCAAITYLGEIGNQNTRGIFLAIVKLSINTGILFVLLLGAYLPYNKMNLILLFLPLVFIVTFSFMPDSSHFLEKERKRLDSLVDKKKVKKPIEYEMELLNKEKRRTEENRFILEEKKPKFWEYLEETEGQKNVERLKKLFTNKNNRKAFIIVSLIYVTEAFSGHAAVMAFTQEIFDYSEYSLPAEYAILVMASMKITSSIFSTQIIERIDRKTLFFSSGILATIAQGIVGIFFFMKYNMEMDVSSISWIPLYGITFYEIIGNAGIGSMGIVYSGELFSPDVKGIGITVTNIVYDSVAFLVKLNFYIVVKTLGISGTFFLFSAFCAIGTGIVFYLAPETRGKSLEEIQEIMNFGSRVRKGKSGLKRISRS